MNNKIDKRRQRKVFIKTYGCQMNVYDSQRINDNLDTMGYSPTNTINDADLIVFNTCHIREKAVEKLYSDLGRLRLLIQKKQKDNLPLIGVVGCVAQAEGEAIIRRARIVDFVVGPQIYHRLPQIIEQVKLGRKIVAIEYAIDKFKYLPLPKKEIIRSRGVCAFLTVQEGCDKFCTFCVVPYTRGAEVSRPIKQIMEEAKKLVDSGVMEIVLLGQNVNAWHGEDTKGRKCRFGDLLFYLATINGLKRLRYTTSHPRDMDDTLLAAHRDLSIVMPYLHLPIQSGSDRILKAMNRRHTVAEYLNTIEKIRNIRSDIALSGDFIVGFPGESEEDFSQTLNLVNKIFYASSYSFKYSPRYGTPGAEMHHQIDEKIKEQRLQALQLLLRQQQEQFLKEKIGTKISILIEKSGRYAGQMIGRSPWLIPVCVNTTAKVGTILDVYIEHAERNSLHAKFLQK